VFSVEQHKTAVSNLLQQRGGGMWWPRFFGPTAYLSGEQLLTAVKALSVFEGAKQLLHGT